MKWYAYCVTCGLKLACMKPYHTTSSHGSVVEKFAEHHLESNPDHIVLIGRRYELTKPEPEITFNHKGVAHHG